MKNILVLLLALALALPASATVIATTSSSVTADGVTTTVHIAKPTTPPAPYYRLIYDSVTKKIVAVAYAPGTTHSLFTLYCATTWAEVQAFATANALTGLPATDPATR